MSKEKLHRLIDALPDNMIGEAERFFDYLQIKAKTERARGGQSTESGGQPSGQQPAGR